MNHVTLTLLPDRLELVKVLTRAVRSMDSAGNSGKSDDLYSTFNLDDRNTCGGGLAQSQINTFCINVSLIDLVFCLRSGTSDRSVLLRQMDE